MFSCSCFELLCWLIGAYISYKFLDYIVRIPYVWGHFDRYILITGCDTGFGYELAKNLDADGYNVFAGCLTEMGEEVLRKQCSCRLKTLHMDVSSPESVRKAYEFVKNNLPESRGLWGLVNNAGIPGKVGPVEWLELEDYQEVFGVNLLGLIDTTVTFLPLIKQDKGRIVNTASVFGRTALVGFAPYVVSKYGVEAFSDNLRRQLLDYGCTVHIIEPGFYKTNITSFSTLTRSLEGSWKRLSPEMREEYGQEYFDKAMNQGEMMSNLLCSTRIGDVVDAYKHALLAFFPRARYIVGWDATFLWLPLQMLPEWLGDFLMTRANRQRPIPKVIKQKLK